MSLLHPAIARDNIPTAEFSSGVRVIRPLEPSINVTAIRARRDRHWVEVVAPVGDLAIGDRED
jgi:hypothetical protein